MKRALVWLVPVLALPLAACDGGTKLVAEAALGEGEESRPLANLPVHVLPYDRDAIFDSLTQAAEAPEPQVPEDLQQQRQAVQEAQSQALEAESRWAEVRDSLATLATRMRQMEGQGLRTTPQYKALFDQFTRLEGQVNSLDQARRAANARFQQLSDISAARADSIRVARENWADAAYRDYDAVVAARLKEEKREELTDTTDAAGIATLRVPAGRWWVHARYTLPYQELYWNLPVDVQGDSTTVRLTRETAEIRPGL